MGRQTRQARKWIGIAAKVAVSAAVLALVLTRVDLHGVARSLAAASVSGLAVAGAAFLAIPLLGGLRWWLALRGLGQPARLGPLSALFSTVAVVAQVLPSVAADGVRVWLAVRRGYPLAATVRSVFFERVFMVLAVLALALAAAPLLQARTGAAGPVWVCAALLLAGVAGVAALMLADKLDVGLGRLRPWRAVMAGAPETRRLVLSNWGSGLALAALASNLNFALAAVLLARALGLPVTALDILAFMPAVILATTLPISFGGWGVREGLLVVLLGHVGVAANDALALSVLFGAGNALCGLPGLGVWLIEGRLARRGPIALTAGNRPGALPLDPTGA